MTSYLMLALVPDALCIAACLVAAIHDVRTYSIPNWLTFGAIGSGLVVNAVIGLSVGGSFGLVTALLSSLVGCLLLLIIFGLLGAIRFVGMGDVKLMAGVGALLRWPHVIWALAYVALAGGVLGLVYALARGRLAAVLGNIVKVSQAVFRRGDGVAREAGQVDLLRIPYGVAILIGVVWAVAARYWPAVRLV